MRTVILYDSVFGNTEKLAVHIADTLGATLRRVADLSGVIDFDVLIVGSPTRAFRPTPAITAWLKKLPAGALAGVRAAAFDTRIDLSETDNALLKKMAKRFGYAAEKIHKILNRKGAVMVAEPQGYFVTASEGPLKKGELQRAADWVKKMEQS